MWRPAWDGLCRDKTRPPGKAPLAADVVMRVIEKTKTENAAGRDPLEPANDGQGGGHRAVERSGDLEGT